MTEANDNKDPFDFDMDDIVIDPDTIAAMDEKFLNEIHQSNVQKASNSSCTTWSFSFWVFVTILFLLIVLIIIGVCISLRNRRRKIQVEMTKMGYYRPSQYQMA